MGGNAIKKVIVSRIPLETYLVIKKDILHSLSPLFEIDFAHEVPNKIDFGDIDILYKSNPKVDLKKMILDYFNPVEIVSNGLVTSFAYLFHNEYYQIDLVKCTNLHMSKFFFSYGDLGGVIGTITKFYGISFGEGLWIHVSKETVSDYLKKEIENYTTTKIFLSDDPKEICNYLDLDYERWKVGFKDKVSIFQWVISSSWFQRDIFLNLNSFERKKKDVRPFYKDFNKFIFNENNNLGNQENKLCNPKNKQLEALNYFNKLDLLNKIIEENNIKLERKKKCNGFKFKQFGYCDIDIGIAIVEFKKFIINKYNKSQNDIDFFNNWLDTKSEEEIDLEIYNFSVK